MADIVNLFEVEPGQRVKLYSDATAEVVSNPRDGVWLFVRYLTSPDDPGQWARRIWSSPRTWSSCSRIDPDGLISPGNDGILVAHPRRGSGGDPSRLPGH